jgi:hypothetical protein
LCRTKLESSTSKSKWLGMVPLRSTRTRGFIHGGSSTGVSTHGQVACPRTSSRRISPPLDANDLTSSWFVSSQNGWLAGAMTLRPRVCSTKMCRTSTEVIGMRTLSQKSVTNSKEMCSLLSQNRNSSRLCGAAVGGVPPKVVKCPRRPLGVEQLLNASINKARSAPPLIAQSGRGRCNKTADT